MSEKVKDVCVTCAENPTSYFTGIIWIIANFMIGWAITKTLVGGASYAGFAFMSLFLWIPFVAIIAIAVLYPQGIGLYKFLLDFFGLEPNFWLAFVFWVPVILGIAVTIIVVLFLIWIIFDF